MEQHAHDDQGYRYDNRFGVNARGAGIALIILLLAILTVFVWWLWNKGTMEDKFYRFGQEQADGRSSTAHGTPGGHQGSTAAINPLQLGKLDSLGNFIYDTGDSVTVNLPGGEALRVGNRSTEYRLFEFLNNNSNLVDTVDKTKGWITLDRVFFESGSSGLTQESRTQLTNISNILKAFPQATVKLGGYTDNTGDSVPNHRISASRATAVMNALKSAGASNGMEAEGYGPQWPLADNATAEGKAMNRRVDIRVTKK